MTFQKVVLVFSAGIHSAPGKGHGWPIDPHFKVPNTTAWLVDAKAQNLPVVDPDDFSIDWRSKGAVTPVKAQCGGTCWSFSASGNMEGAWAVAGHGLVSLSEQFLQDGCEKSGSGPYGIPVKGSQTDGKAASEAQYPTYVGSDPKCAHKACAQTGYAVQINTVQCLKNGGPESDILNWLQRGPVGVSIAAGGFSGYRNNGIIGVDGVGDCTASQIDHAVLIIGYGIENGNKYWIMKNSWGTGFGESGFWRMAYGVDCMKIADGGPCQVTSVGSAPPSPGPSPSPPSPSPSGWATISDKQASPPASAIEYKGDLGVMNSAEDCLHAAQGHADANYALWNSHSGKNCYICDLSGRGSSTSWKYSDLQGAVSFAKASTADHQNAFVV
jgi:hypothetical protein